MLQPDGFPMLERMIACTGPRMKTRLAADGPDNDVSKGLMKGVGTEDDCQAPLTATLPGESHVDDDNLAVVICSRRGHRPRLPKPWRGASLRVPSTPDPRDPAHRGAG